MSESVFYSEADCAQYLRANLSAHTLSAEVEVALSAALAPCFEEQPRSPPPGTLGLMVRRWIVRVDDLKLYDEFVRAMTAAAGATFFLDQARLLAAGVGVTGALGSILRNAWRSSANVTSDEWTILLAIKERYPLRPRKEELLSILSELRRSDGSAWSEDALKKTLERLEKYPTRSGVKKFVALDGDGGWGLEGV